MTGMKILVTGAAGFIGAALCRRLLARGDAVAAVDNINDYYDVTLKQARLDCIAKDNHAHFEFEKMDIADRRAVAKLFAAQKFDAVIHLAAQAGVRYSLENPAAYVDANLVGFGNILEACRRAEVKHLLFASSSSVYGGNLRMPFGETDNTDRPLSLYAASKKANELMAHSYAHLYRLRCTGLRFFTVYGPWGRPDMAFFKFAELMLAGRAIPIYNHGDLARDFTYIDDVVESVVRILDAPASPNSSDRTDKSPPYQLYNIGNGKCVPLMEYIRALEAALNVRAEYEMLPMQAGDVAATFADTDALARDFDFRPATSIENGLAAFADWYRDYYRIAAA